MDTEKNLPVKLRSISCDNELFKELDRYLIAMPILNCDNVLKLRFLTLHYFLQIFFDNKKFGLIIGR
jgi:hypothetical protein